MRRSLLRCAHCALLPCCRGAAWLRFEREVLTEPESAASSSRCSPRGTQAGRCYCFRSFGFECQGPCSAFTSWRARKRDPKTFALAAHNQELVLGHVTFVLQQLFQINLERGLCSNHRIERLLHRGRQIICIDVLPLQFFPCHCLAPNALTKLKVSSPQRTGRRLFCGNETTFFAVTTSASAMRVLRAPRLIAS